MTSDLIREFKVERARVRSDPKTEMTGIYRFIGYLTHKGWNFDTAPPDVLSRWVTEATDGLSPNGIRRYLVGIRALRDFCVRRGVTIPEWSLPVLPRVRESIPTVLRGDALEDFDRRARELREPFRTAIRLLPVSALRPGEMCALARPDIDIVRHTTGGDTTVEVWLLIKGIAGVGNAKGTRDRRVPLLGDAIALFQYYLVHVRPRLVGGAKVFPGRSPGNPIAVVTMELHVRTIGKAMGLELTPRDLRHTAATFLSESGVDLKTIQKILGHTSSRITDRYIHMSPGAVQRNISQVRAPWLTKE